MADYNQKLTLKFVGDISSLAAGLTEMQKLFKDNDSALISYKDTTQEVFDKQGKLIEQTIREYVTLGKTFNDVQSIMQTSAFAEGFDSAKNVDITEVYKKKAKLFEQDAKEAEAKQRLAIETERTIVQNGSNSIITLKLQEAEKLRLIEKKKQEELAKIREQFATGELSWFNASGERSKVLATTKTATTTAQQPVNLALANEQEEALAIQTQETLQKLENERLARSLKNLEIQAAAKAKAAQQEIDEYLLVEKALKASDERRAKYAMERALAIAEVEKKAQARRQAAIIDALNNQNKANQIAQALQAKLNSSNAMGAFSQLPSSIDEAEKLKQQNQQLLADFRRAEEERIAIAKYGATSYEAIAIQNANKRKQIEEQLGLELKRIQIEVLNQDKTFAEGEIASVNAIKTAYAQISSIPVGPKENDFNRVKGGFKDILKTVWDYYIAYSLINTATSKISQAFSSIVPIGIALDAARSSLISTLGSEGMAESALKALRQESKRTGIEIGLLMTNFKNFQASTSIAGASIQSTWRMFTNLNQIITALHLNTEEANGVFLAMAQIFNKGKVQSEELVKQLGNLLPGAYAAFADSMGISGQKLQTIMKAGGVFAEVTMDKFLQSYSQRFAASFVIAADLLNANIGRMNSAFTALGQAIYTSVSPALNSIVKSITSITDSITELVKNGKGLDVIWAGFTSLLGTAGIVTFAYGLQKLPALPELFTSIKKTIITATNAAIAFKTTLQIGSVIGVLYGIVSFFSDLTASADQGGLAVMRLTKEMAEFAAKQERLKASPLTFNIEDDPKLIAFQDTAKKLRDEITTLQERKQDWGIFPRFFGGGLRQEEIDDIKTYYDKINKEFENYAKSTETKVLKVTDFLNLEDLGGFMSPEATIKVKEMYLALTAVRMENEKTLEIDRQRLAAQNALNKEIEGMPKMEDLGNKLVKESVGLKAQAQIFDLEVARAKLRKDGLAEQEAMQEKLKVEYDLEKQISAEKQKSVTEQAKKVEEAIDLKLKEHPELPKDDPRFAAMRKEAQEQLSLVNQQIAGEQAESTAKYLTSLQTLIKDHQRSDNSEIKAAEILTKLSIDKISAESRTRHAELAETKKDFEQKMQLNETGLSIEENYQKVREMIEEEARLKHEALHTQQEEENRLQQKLEEIASLREQQLNAQLEGLQKILDKQTEILEKTKQTAEISSPTETGVNALDSKNIAKLGVKISTAKDVYSDLGYSKFESGGIIANLIKESGLNENRWQNDKVGSEGYGLAQWDETRRGGFKKQYGYDMTSEAPVGHDKFKDELTFVDYELKHNEAKAGELLKQADASGFATAVAFHNGYERSADSKAKVISRGLLGNTVVNYKDLETKAQSQAKQFEFSEKDKQIEVEKQLKLKEAYNKELEEKRNFVKQQQELDAEYLSEAGDLSKGVEKKFEVAHESLKRLFENNDYQKGLEQLKELQNFAGVKGGVAELEIDRAKTNDSYNASLQKTNILHNIGAQTEQIGRAHV